MKAESLGTLATLLTILGLLASVALQQGRIMQRQDDLDRDLQRVIQVMTITHPDASTAFGFSKE